MVASSPAEAPHAETSSVIPTSTPQILYFAVSNIQVPF
jgi:hypothetical protein